MSEMIKRVAMVIDQGIMMDDDSDDIARAVIEALREPTPTMIKAAEISLDETTIGRPKGIIDTHKAMIEAAL